MPTYTPLAGSAGRIRDSSNTPIAEITGWRQKQTSEVFKVTTFESSTDANGVINENTISSNIAGFVFNINGFFNADASSLQTSATPGKLPIGTVVTLDFVYSKASSLGRYNVSCIVNSFEDGPLLREAQTFSAEVTVNGVLPPLSTTPS